MLLSILPSCCMLLKRQHTRYLEKNTNPSLKRGKFLSYKLTGDIAVILESFSITISEMMFAPNQRNKKSRIEENNHVLFTLQGIR